MERHLETFSELGELNPQNEAKTMKKQANIPGGGPNRDEALAGAANRPLTGSLTQCDHCTVIPDDMNVVAASHFAPGLRFLVPNFL